MLGNQSVRHEEFSPRLVPTINSRKFGKDHRWATNRPDRSGYGGNRYASEAPNWHSHMFDIRPARHKDKRVARQIVQGVLDPEEAAFPFTGTRRPHVYYW